MEGIAAIVKDCLAVDRYKNHILSLLSGCSLREILSKVRAHYDGLPSEADMHAEFNKRTDKGLFGKIIEYGFFGQKPNSKSTHDLACGVEIKACAFKVLRNGNVNAKERQTLGNCGNKNDYSTFSNIIKTPDFSKSSVFQKCKRFLLFIREGNPGKNLSFEILMNAKILFIIDVDLPHLPPEVKTILDDDYKIIRERIANQSVTQQSLQYLHTCSHGSGHGSTNMALAFTPKFITILTALNLAKLWNRPYEGMLVQKGASISLNRADFLVKTEATEITAPRRFKRKCPPPEKPEESEESEESEETEETELQTPRRFKRKRTEELL